MRWRSAATRGHPPQRRHRAYARSPVGRGEVIGPVIAEARRSESPIASLPRRVPAPSCGWIPAAGPALPIGSRKSALPMSAAAWPWTAHPRRTWNRPGQEFTPSPTRRSASPEDRMLANSLIELDRAHLIHPVSSYRGHEAQGVRVLKSAKGATVTDASGRQLLDGFAGLWCVNAGYGHDSIVEAAARQMRELPYATAYFDLGSEPAIRLASELAERAPGDLNHVFFTLGGSDAVDSTIRLRPLPLECQGRAESATSSFPSSRPSRVVGGRRGLTAARLSRGFGIPFEWQPQDPPLSLPQPGRARTATRSSPHRAALKAKIEEIGPERVAAFYADPGSGGVMSRRKADQGVRELCRRSTASCLSPTR